MTSRFFRTPEAVYVSVRTELDLVFGHPYERIAEDGTVVRTESCLPVADLLAHDGAGRVVCALIVEDCLRPEVAPRLEALLGTGDVEEISEEDYFTLQSVSEP